MTTPPPGETPQPYYGQQPYPPQSYPPQPDPYGPPPGYPVAYGPPGFGAPANPRPGLVTAAAVLSFIWGGFSILASIVTLAAGSFVSGAGNLCEALTADAERLPGTVCAGTGTIGGLLIAVGLVLIIAAALLIWGGVVALSGKNAKVGVIAGGLLIVVQIVSLIASGSGVGFSIAGIIVPVLIVVFLMNANSKAWFKSKGGATF